MKLRTVLATLLFLAGLVALSGPGANALAQNMNSSRVGQANHAAYRTVQYYYYDPYYSPYVYHRYYYTPGFYINTPFFGFNFGF